MKKTLIFAIFLISGIVLGSLLAMLTQGVSWLSWLGYGPSIGLSPATLNLEVVSLTFGFSFRVTVAHVITIGIALALYGTRRNK